MCFHIHKQSYKHVLAPTIMRQITDKQQTKQKNQTSAEETERKKHIVHFTQIICSPIRA